MRSSTAAHLQRCRRHTLQYLPSFAHGFPANLYCSGRFATGDTRAHLPCSSFCLAIAEASACGCLSAGLDHCCQSAQQIDGTLVWQGLTSPEVEEARNTKTRMPWATSNCSGPRKTLQQPKNSSERVSV